MSSDQDHTIRLLGARHRRAILTLQQYPIGPRPETLSHQRCDVIASLIRKTSRPIGVAGLGESGRWPPLSELTTLPVPPARVRQWEVCSKKPPPWPSSQYRCYA